MAQDQLFLLSAPFEDGPGEMWFCTDCATMEGVLLANPHWLDYINVHRCAFPRPRAEIIDLLGEDNQGMPVLVLTNSEKAPAAAERSNGYAFLTAPKEIARYLVKTYGGAGPHP